MNTTNNNINSAYAMGRVMCVIRKACEEANTTHACWSDYVGMRPMSAFVQANGWYENVVKKLSKDREKAYNLKISEYSDKIDMGLINKNQMTQEEECAMMVGFHQSMDI